MFCRIIFASWLIHLIFIIPAVHAKPIRYVAIGDSYTVATGIEEKDSWPSQLTRKLTSAGIEIDLVATLGQRGWTSQQVIEGKLPLLKDLKPDFITSYSSGSTTGFAKEPTTKVLLCELKI